jgi:hypothetical protein
MPPPPAFVHEIQHWSPTTCLRLDLQRKRGTPLTNQVEALGEVEKPWRARGEGESTLSRAVPARRPGKKQGQFRHSPVLATISRLKHLMGLAASH